MEQQTIIYKNILENMSGGVMTVGLDGRIITFNQAASRILGLDREDVLDKNFAAVFFEYDGNDDFNQALLDAIYESSVSHNRVVDFNAAGKPISLSITTSFLQSVEGDEVQKVGVIAVFDDITEVKKLRDAEIQLTEQLKSAYEELEKYTKKLEKKVVELEIKIDEKKRKEDVENITETDYFRLLAERAEEIKNE